MVELDGKLVRFEMRKTLALLAYLRLEGREVSRKGWRLYFGQSSTKSTPWRICGEAFPP